jgi:uncharacterized membrane-anchored protein
MGLLLWWAPVAAVLAQPAEKEKQSEAEALASWESFLGSMTWAKPGETGRMGDQAQIVVPEGYVFTGAEGTQELMEAFGNLLSDQELGFVAPARTAGQPDFEWFAVFEFEEVGYVKDDEKEDLDAEAMMESMLEGQKAANEQRRAKGFDTLSITGWTMEPKYNERTNNLEWAVALQSGDGTKNTNFNTRLLGRRGVMKVTLVCSPEVLEATIPAYQELLEGFSFQQGQRYAEFTKGDKIAAYGLTGLVVGGGAAVLAKTGLLKKLLKPILLGLVALGALVKKIFSRKSEEPSLTG